MQKHIKFNIAKIYHKLSFDEKTDYLYLNLNPGLKTVKGDLNNPVGEQIYHIGDLAKYDDSWGIIYPSPYWIPAPYIFDIVIWLKNIFNINIIPKFNKYWTYEIIFPDELKELENDFNNKNKVFSDFSSIYNSEKTDNDKLFITIEKCYEDAVNEIALASEQFNWIDKLYKYI